MDIYNGISFAGIFVLMVVAWVFSTDRRVINVQCIVFGVGLQLAVAAAVFWAPGSTKLFLWLNDVVVRFLNAAMEGQRFLFGPLAAGPGQADANGNASIGFILATQALAVIIFFGNRSRSLL